MKNLTKKIKNLFHAIKADPYRVLIFLAILYPFYLFLNNIMNGSIPFWYDPARDFLLALDNLKKPTLIGPPSGIPGIFYGPYWLWMISFGLIISKDPRFVAILVSFLPYFTVFPFILFKFSNIYSKKISILLWLLFIFSFQTYTTLMWNPHLAPLLFLILTYLLITPSAEDINIKYLIKILVAGIISGLLLNFHISFGLGIFIASVLYIFVTSFLKVIKSKNNLFRRLLYRLLVLLLFICGFFSTFIPYAVFEFRHDFLQSRALVKTITNAYLYNSASVGQTGLKPLEITSQLFIERTSQFLSIKNEYILAIYLLIIGFTIYQLLRKKIIFTENEKNIALYLTICLSILFILFVSSINPVWQYHFIGVEVIVMLLAGIVIKKWRLLSETCSFWVAVLVISSLTTFLYSYNRTDPLSLSSLATKKYIAEKIFLDAKSQSFSVFAYSPAIYTYDFDYLFKWLGEDVYHRIPEQDITKADFVYLIIPKTSETIKNDFINYKTPEKSFTTKDTWPIPDGTIIIKRVPINLINTL